MKVIGIDIAARYFQVHGVDTTGKAVLRRKVTGDVFLKLMSDLPPCIVGLKAGSRAHHWARQIAKFGHEVRLMLLNLCVRLWPTG